MKKFGFLFSLFICFLCSSCSIFFESLDDPLDHAYVDFFDPVLFKSANNLSRFGRIVSFDEQQPTSGKGIIGCWKLETRNDSTIYQFKSNGKFEYNFMTKDGEYKTKVNGTFSLGISENGCYNITYSYSEGSKENSSTENYFIFNNTLYEVGNIWDNAKPGTKYKNQKELFDPERIAYEDMYNWNSTETEWVEFNRVNSLVFKSNRTTGNGIIGTWRSKIYFKGEAYRYYLSFNSDGFFLLDVDYPAAIHTGIYSLSRNEGDCNNLIMEIVTGSNLSGNKSLYGLPNLKYMVSNNVLYVSGLKLPQ